MQIVLQQALKDQAAATWLAGASKLSCQLAETDGAPQPEERKREGELLYNSSPSRFLMAARNSASHFNQLAGKARSAARDNAEARYNESRALCDPRVLALMKFALSSTNRRRCSFSCRLLPLSGGLAG